jgi:hypothetical protein
MMRILSFKLTAQISSDLVEKFFRTRWREGYLRHLAEHENSFIAEYRLDPVSFDLLSEMIEPDLDVNASMVKISTKSAPITLHS